MPIPTSAMLQTPTPNAKSRAIEMISHWIIEGSLEAGEKIRDIDIAHALGVSRMPVREALQALETIGFIETEPNRGTHVSSLRVDDIYALYKTIARLETLGLEEAMNPVRSQTIEELYMLNHRYQQTLNQSNIHAMFDAGRAFHQRLVYSDGNRFCQQALAPLVKTAARYEYPYRSTAQPVGQESAIEHRMILEALVQHNITRAQEILTQSWLHTATMIQSWYAALAAKDTVSPHSTPDHEEDS